MTPAIRVDNLGKRYRIQSFGRSSTLLGETILSKLRRPRGHVARDLWAVRDVSFEVAHGEVLGLIGRNGAGKSTLLKLLARVTQPTTGRAVLDGRVGSLLEVGTGFHPELTGRENIFLSGSILGMRRREIAAKFDEIVAFAEIDAFLDTPVKRYSSGMYLRLAFAVAAHLPTEILLVDEVLAVGDWAFQKKCLDAMKDNVRTGRTVVFVSHNMVAVNALCQRAILVADGQVRLDGPAQNVTAEYLGRARAQLESQGITAVTVNEPALERARIPGLRFTAVRVTNPAGGPPGAGDPLDIELDYQATNQFSALAFAISLRDPSGVDVLHLSTMPISGVPIDALHPNGTIVLSISALPLSAGRYDVDLGFARERVEWLLQVEDVAEFDVEPRDVYGSGFAPLRQHGLLVTPHHWTHRPSGAAPDREPAPVSHA